MRNTRSLLIAFTLLQETSPSVLLILAILGING